MAKDIVQEAKERFKASIDAEHIIRQEYEDDYKFSAGDQWPERYERERELDGRPCLTINRLPASIASLVSDARQNSPTIQVHPVDDQTDPKLAETLEGLIRQVEASSDADQAYDFAIEGAARGGIGAWRICTDFAGDDTFDQEISIERIKNPLTVYWDPEAQKYDKSDAQYCFVTEIMSIKAFEAKYPDVDKSGWSDSGRGDDDWHVGESVRVAEYWVKEAVTKELALLETGETIDVTDLPKDTSLDAQAGIVRRRTVESHKVVRYVLAGDEVIEGPQDWPSQYIPIIGVFGPELVLDGKTHYQSLIRYAKDPQRQYNFWSSALTEKAALAPKAPWVATQAQVEGHEHIWANANRKNYSYLPYNADPDTATPPQRTNSSTIANGDITLIGLAADDIKATTGIFDASLGARGNETSGRAILARQREGQNATFAWLDNLSRSVRYTGRILVDMIPRIYDGERVIRILGLDGQSEVVPINQTITLHDGSEQIVNDLTVGKFDVVVSTGPSYQTQRLEAADSMMQFIQAVPAAASLTADLMVKSMDWPNADQIAKRLAKQLPPDIDEEGPTEPPQPDPKEQLDVANSQASLEGKELVNEQRRRDLEKEDLQEAVNQLVDERLAQLIAQTQPQQVT